MASLIRLIRIVILSATAILFFSSSAPAQQGSPGVINAVSVINGVAGLGELRFDHNVATEIAVRSGIA